jgi:hypothetical protein
MAIGDPEKRGRPPEAEEKKRREPLTGKYVTKLTPEVVALFTTSIRAGASLDTAAKYVGVAQGTMRKWLSEGRNALQRAGSPEEADPKYRDQVAFVVEVDEALSEFKINLTGTILVAGREQWQANAWLLERRFPDEFGRRQRIDHANAEGQPFQVAPTPLFDPSKLSDDELDTLISLAEKARPDGMKALPVHGQPELRVLESGEGG